MSCSPSPEDLAAAEAHLSLGLAARDRHEHAAALACFENALQAAPDHLIARLEAGAALRHLNRLDEAEAAYAAILAAQPDQTYALLGRGLCAKARGDLAAAAGWFACAPDDGNPWPRLELATVRREQGRLVEARAIYQALLATAHAALAQIGLGFCARAAGDGDAAAAHFQAALAAEPDNLVARLEIAAGLREAGQHAAAAAVYHEILADQPEQFYACLGLGHCARAAGDRAAALAYFERAHRAEPGNDWARLEIANELRDAGDFTAARATAQAVLRQHPASLNALTVAGMIERAAGAHEAALALFHTAHHRHPAHAQSLLHMAVQARLLGRQQECDALLAQAAGLDPLCRYITIQQAEQAMLAQNPQAALQIYQAAAQRQPQLLAFRLGAVRALADGGSIEPALAALRNLRAEFPPTPELTHIEMILLRQSGRLAEALSRGRAARAAWPRHFGVWLESCESEMLTADTAAVQACLASSPASTAGERAQRLRMAGLLAERQCRFAEALAQYQAAETQNPQDEAVQAELIRLTTMLLRLDEARGHLQRYCQLTLPAIRLQGRSPNISQNHYGQRLDDYCLDAALVQQLQKLQTLPPQPRLAALRPVVAANPDSTAAAVTLLVALAEAGYLASHTSTPTSQIIPKTILHYWDTTNIPADVAALMRSWQQHNPDYRAQIANDTTAQQFLRRHTPPAVQAAYSRIREPAQKADLFRLAWLAVAGGIYADADDRCTASLHPLLGSAELILYQEDHGTLANNFIAAIPRHPVIMRALADAVTAINRGDTDTLWLSTGPGLITRAFAACYATATAGFLNHITLLDRRTLAQAVTIHCHTGYKKTPRYWVNAAFKQA